jgi:hypothetical protein
MVVVVNLSTCRGKTFNLFSLINMETFKPKKITWRLLVCWPNIKIIDALYKSSTIKTILTSFFEGARQKMYRLKVS